MQAALPNRVSKGADDVPAAVRTAGPDGQFAPFFGAVGHDGRAVRHVRVRRRAGPSAQRIGELFLGRIAAADAITPGPGLAGVGNEMKLVSIPIAPDAHTGSRG